jgi:hypothetical protein
VLVAPGVYEESLKLEAPVVLLGGTDSSAPEGVVLRSPSFFGIEVSLADRSAQAALAGLSIRDTAGVGLMLTEGRLVLREVTIRDTRQGVPPSAGHGLLVAGGELDAERITVERSEQVGVLLTAGQAELRRARITDNELGGLRADGLDGPLTVLDSEILANRQMGVGLFAGTSLLRGNTISDTQWTPDSIGDGVIVSQFNGATEPVTATLEKNTIERSARVGVLFGTGSRGGLLGNTILDSSTKTGFGAGVWLQGKAGGEEGIRIEANRIEKGRMLGLTVTSGSRAVIVGNTIAQISNSSIPTGDGGVAEIGDGVGSFLGSSVYLENNTIRDCQRLGLLFDSVDASTSRTLGNKILHNASVGAVVQNTLAFEQIDIQDNEYEGNGEDTPAILGSEDAFTSPQPTLQTN